ncbi:hypothetical protein ACHAWF_000160 [Thalassiosira exigua]
MGCQDGSFVLKSLLRLRRQQNLDTFVVFADLVKAFDTSNHELIIEILEKYGALTKFCNDIQRLYDNLKVVLKIGKEKAEIGQGVGVQQGGNLSHVIFLFLMTAFAKNPRRRMVCSRTPQNIAEVSHSGRLRGLQKGTAH